MRPSSTRCAAILAAAGLIALAAGCDSDNTASTFTPAPTTAPKVRTDDGVLKIGVLIPQDSANADIGEAIGSAVKLAEDQIDAAGGLRGQLIDIVAADEGVTGVGVDPALATLFDAGVDAIVGPASSINALASLAEIVDAGVVACSPTASAALLDEFPDDGLFFRTIPSDSLQALAIADEVDRTGATEATVVYIDDDYGQLFRELVETALHDEGIEPVLSVPYLPNNVSIAAAAGRVAAKASGVVVVLGDPTSGQVMLATIDTAEPTVRPQYVVNDAMRRPSTSAEPMDVDLAGRITGVSPLAYSTNTLFLEDLGATCRQPQSLCSERVRLCQPHCPRSACERIDAASSNRRADPCVSAPAGRRA